MACRRPGARRASPSGGNSWNGGSPMAAKVSFMLAWLLALLLALLLEGASAQSRVILDHPARFAANVGDIGATLTEIQAAPPSNQYIYVTTIILESSTAPAGSFALRAGQGANCATNPVGLFPQPGVSSPTLTYLYPANTSPPLVITLAPPVRAPAGYAMCLVGTATNLARGQVHGFIAP